MSTQTFEQTRWSLADLLPVTEGPELDQILTELEEAAAFLSMGPEAQEQNKQDEGDACHGFQV